MDGGAWWATVHGVAKSWTQLSDFTFTYSPPCQAQDSSKGKYEFNDPQLASIRQMSRQVSSGSAGDYQADERAGVARLSWRVSGRCRAAPVASIRQMSRQVSRGSPGEYQADERAGVEWLSWQVSGR